MSKTLKARLRKAIAGFLMVTTIVWLSGVVALIPVAQAATIVDGDVIRNPSATGMAQFDVYIVKLMGAKKFKRLVLNPQVFTSYGHLKWENVKSVTTEEMNEYKTSGIVRVETDPKVLALAPLDDTGSKSWLNVTAADFVVAGGDWDSVYVINAVDAANYVVASDLTTQAQVSTYLTTGVLPGGVVPTPTPVVGALNVALSADTPATGTLISGATTAQAGADLMHFTLTGTGTVTGVALKRIGVSGDTTLSNVYLFDGTTRITDSASVSTGSTINFNNISGLTVSGSKTISVKSDILAGTAGQTVGVQLTGVTMTGGVVGGTLPISGNIMSIASATLATVALATPTSAGASDPSTGVLVWQGTVNVGTRDVLLTRLALRQIGSIVSADINNFKLLVDGTEVATVASLDSNGYATFVLSKALASGARTLKVNADIIGGSGRTVHMSLRAAYDISTTDTQYGAGITTTGTFPFQPGTAIAVSSGSMTVVKSAASQSSNLTVGASDQSLATYTFTAFGEPIKVETLKVGILGTIATEVITDTTLRNVKIMVNGSQVGSTTDVPAAASFAANVGTQFTTNFTVVPGTPATVEIRGDMVDTTDADEAVTVDAIALGYMTAVQAVLVGGTGRSNGVPQVTITAVNVPTDANVLGNNLTIASGSISIAKTSNYGNQTVVVPQTAYKIGSYVLTGNATEAVNLNTIYVGFTAGSTATEATDLSSLYVVYGTTTTTPKGTVSATILNGNSWSINQTLAVNQSMTFDVYATIASSLSTNAIISTLAVAGTTALSGIAVYADGTSNTALDAGFTGQTITGGTGTINVTVDASTPVSALIDDSGTATTAAFKFAATNDGYTITNMTVTITDASSVATVKLMDGVTPVVGGEKAAATEVAYSGLSIPVPANGNKVITVQLVMGSVGPGAGLTGGALLTTMTAGTVKSSGGTNSTPAGLPKAGNAMYVYKALPLISQIGDGTTDTIGNGTKILDKFSVVSSGGTIGWNKLVFTVAKTTAPVLTVPTLKNADTNVAIAGAFTILDVTNSDALCNAAALSCTFTFVPTAEQQVSGTANYVFGATVASAATTDSIQTSIAAPSVFADSTTGFAYIDADDDGVVSVGDTRYAATLQVTSAYVQTTTGGVVGPVGADTANDEVRSFGTFTSLQTIIVTADSATTIGALTGTLISTGGFTCNAYDTAGGAGSITTTMASILSIKCTNGTNNQIVLNTANVGDASGDVTTITLTKEADYAAASVVAAGVTDSDSGLTIQNDPSFIWSDVSAAGHTVGTVDWSNDFLVKNLPLATSNLE